MINDSDSPRKAVKRGFTLAEVLVTLAIIAVMAAVLLPSLNSQLSKGDAGRMAQDLTNIQTGAQAFLADVHRYPSSMTQLTTALSGTPTDLLGSTIPSALMAKWKGPYVAKDVVSATSVGTLSTAFTKVTNTPGNAVDYLAISITGIATADWVRLEDILDEGYSSSTASTTGLVRFSVPSTTVTYFALPIQ